MTPEFIATPTPANRWVLEQLQKDGTVIARREISAVELNTGLRIGRAMGNDFVLDDPHCAPHHATLLWGAEPDSAIVQDAGTINALFDPRGKRVREFSVASPKTWQIGHTQLRLRSSAWDVEPERQMSTRWMWAFALLAWVGVALHTAYQTWLMDTGNQPPPYLYALAGTAAALGAWSAAYALLGRVLSGVDRFFNHVVIAGCGTLALIVLDNALELLAFSASWLWPLQISRYVAVLAVALTVRAHLRLADERHWSYTRYAVAVVALLFIGVPIAQSLITHGKWTTIQAISHLEHPTLRIADGKDLESFMKSASALETRANDRRSKDGDDDAQSEADY